MTFRYSRQAQRFVEQAERIVADRLIARIDLFELDPFPHGCKRVKGKKNIFRVRVGPYRILYDPYEKLVVAIDDRETVY